MEESLSVSYTHLDVYKRQQEDNEKMIERLTGVPVIARVRDGARELEADLEVLKRVYD